MLCRRQRYLFIETLESRRLLSASPSIPGTVGSYNVSIDRYDSPLEVIDASRPAWVVIHGNDSAPTTNYIDSLAQALHFASAGQQVLTLDWSEIAALPIYTTENQIKPVAEWASSALSTYGFSGGLLNLVGHSFGAYVAAEMSERIDVGTGVNTIVGLDPAADFPFGYNPVNEVDFAATSQFSWTFTDADGLFGNATTPGTADEAITVENSTHSGVVSLFSSMLNAVGEPGVFGYFPIPRLLSYASGPWIPNQYSKSGASSNSGIFEAVITADSSGIVPVSIDFVADETRPAEVAEVQFGDGTAQRSRIDELKVTFEGPVDIDPNAFSLIKRGTSGGLVTTDFTTQLDPSGNTIATLSFSGSFTRAGGALLDGYYQLIIDGSKVTRAGTSLTLDGDGDGLAGGNFFRGALETDNFFALYADTNGDGVVGIAEFGQFRATFGKNPDDDGYDERFDYDGAGVGIGDFGQFRARFGRAKLPFE